jgi:methylated-DNA-[protein]-cysteine S-methyltransferase
MNSIQIEYLQTDFGELLLGGFEGRLCLCDWRYRKNRAAIDTRIQKGLNAGTIESGSEIVEMAKLQLLEYFEGFRKVFDLPLLLVGTDFQKRVWNELLKIPFGRTETYQSLSKRLDNLSGIRAIAAANGANALSVIVPCHRIIGSDGNMVGYAGGVNVKKRLLQLEGVFPRQDLILF